MGLLTEPLEIDDLLLSSMVGWTPVVELTARNIAATMITSTRTDRWTVSSVLSRRSRHGNRRLNACTAQTRSTTRSSMRSVTWYEHGWPASRTAGLLDKQRRSRRDDALPRASVPQCGGWQEYSGRNLTRTTPTCAASAADPEHRGVCRLPDLEALILKGWSHGCNDAVLAGSA